MANYDGQRVLPGDKEDIGLDHTPEQQEYLRLASQNYDSSTDYLDSSIRKTWEDNLDRFHSKHPTGSKYHHSSYKFRSRLFRPKTRSSSRRAEASIAAAMFSNDDLVQVKGQNRGDEQSKATAEVNKELLHYRLEHTIPWYTTCVGAYQDTRNYGICISHQTWTYETVEDVEYIPVFEDNGLPMMDEEGNELGEERRTKRVLKDSPELRLLAPENFRFDANSDWRDPIADSPFLIEQIPMYANDVLERMKKKNGDTGEPDWIDYDLSRILSAQRIMDENESVRQARQGRERQDPLDTQKYNENSTVWVYLHVMRRGSEDIAFYTLGSQLMLSDPQPVESVMPLGRRAYTIGFSVIEAHRNYPTGENEMGAPLQEEINEAANQRNDNVKLAMNKRYQIRRGARVDLQALARSTPGGGVMVGDIEKDVKEMETRDVTGSAYNEQQYLELQFDELLGNFSASSVANNRRMNETVGGMNMLQGDATLVQEYGIKTFIETWAEQVLRKLQKLEAMFETDEVILALAGENAQLYQKYAIDEITDELLNRELTVSVNVGMGNATPGQKVEKISTGLSVINMVPELAARVDAEEVGKELFSALGFGDGERFIMSDEDMAERSQGQPQEVDHTLEVAQIRAEVDKYQTDKQWELGAMRLALDEQIKMPELYERLGLEDRKLALAERAEDTKRKAAAMSGAQKTREMNIKERMGTGI